MVNTADIETYEYSPPKPSRLTRLLWRAAGGDAVILERCPYGEQVKFACLGGIVASTGVLAGVAAIYALQTIFLPADRSVGWLKYDVTMVGSLLLGAGWGCIIFNLDRYIVASTGKGDGTEKITKQEFLNALPRMLLGFIIAVTISKPLEIRIFKPEIDAYLYRLQQLEVAENEEAIAIRYADQRKGPREAIAALRQQLAAQQQRADSAERIAREELDGNAGGRGRGAGAVYREKQSIAARERAAYERMQAELAPRIAENETEVAKVAAAEAAEVKAGEAAAAGMAGFLARMRAAHHLAGGAVIWSITALFVAIELTPIFFKLMLIKGPYDYLEENAKRLVLARHGVDVRHRFQPGIDPSDLEEVRYHHPNRYVKLHRVYTGVQTKAYRRWGEDEAQKIDPHEVRQSGNGNGHPAPDGGAPESPS